MGAVLHVPMGAKGKGEYVISSDKFSGDSSRKFIDSEEFSEQYKFAFAMKKDGITKEQAYDMALEKAKEKHGNDLKARYVASQMREISENYERNSYAAERTKLEKEFDTLTKGKKKYSFLRQQAHLMSTSNKTLQNYINQIKAESGELRFNPNHDPENGRFTGGQFTDGNFSSSAIRFSGGGGSKGLTNGEKNVTLDSKGNPYRYPQLTLPKKEYGKVMHEINTLYDTNYKGKEKSLHRSGDYLYRFEIHEFNEYNIFSKEKI